MVDPEIVARALRAASKVACLTGAPEADPVLLHCSRHISALLPRQATVARIRVATAESLAAGTRELAVVRHLAERHAPVVAPCETMPSEPHVIDGMMLTLWPQVPHVKADYDDHDELGRAAQALQLMHDAFASCPGELPSFMTKIEDCAASLRHPTALPGLSIQDRTFLLKVFDRSGTALEALDVAASRIHGDAHMGNVFFTPEGPLWTDFEAASLGPREWDASGVPHLAAFRPLDHQVYAIMSDLRSLCVTVWCAAAAADSDKRAAAEYHLGRLKAEHGTLT